jgi:hypothetical protein
MTAFVKDLLYDVVSNVSIMTKIITSRRVIVPVLIKADFIVEMFAKKAKTAVTTNVEMLTAVITNNLFFASFFKIALLAASCCASTSFCASEEMGCNAISNVTVVQSRAKS